MLYRRWQEAACYLLVSDFVYMPLNTSPVLHCSDCICSASVNGETNVVFHHPQQILPEESPWRGLPHCTIEWKVDLPSLPPELWTWLCFLLYLFSVPKEGKLAPTMVTMFNII
jgi:hypothetical protein